MKDLLKQAVQACINEDMAAARSFYAQYFELKSKSILEDSSSNKLISGSCDSCGESATTSKNILDSGKWVCPNCGGKKFEPETELQESADIKKGAFHKWLGKDESEQITDADVAKGLKSDNPHVRKMAQFAKNMRENK